MQVGEMIYYILGTNSWIHRRNYIGETSRSWLVGDSWRPTKLPKATTKFVTVKEWEEQVWAGEHRHAISEAIRNVSVERLRQIANLIDYREEN